MIFGKKTQLICVPSHVQKEVVLEVLSAIVLSKREEEL